MKLGTKKIRKKQLAGVTFGSLVVQSEAEEITKYIRRWHCRCCCGNSVIVQQGNLMSGHTTSCGCQKNLSISEKNTRHGFTKGMYRRTFQMWTNMKRRCLDPSDKNYVNYGARGIGVCERWLDFANFIADMGTRPDGLTIERINNDGSYEPGNVRWATMLEQAKNKRPRQRSHG